ncbi:Hachiman antiphage defense system protein HamA [Aquirufa regiilacus]
MTKQIKLIGSHPSEEHPMGDWLVVNDIPVTNTKCHRELTERNPKKNDDLILWVANKIIEHHYSSSRIEKLKEKYTELGFEKYANQHRRLPNDLNVKKGNATEILLIEYIQSTLKKDLIHSFKLRYNPNVDQAMKGDDTLLIELIEQEDTNDLRIYLGESKFRTTPAKKAVKEISSSLDKDKMPLSYTFLLEEVEKQNKELALKLDNFIVQDIKDKGQLIYTGLLLSNEHTSSFVESNLSNDNQDLIFISIGIKDPENFINLAFEKANQLIANPSAL